MVVAAALVLLCQDRVLLHKPSPFWVLLSPSQGETVINVIRIGFNSFIPALLAVQQNRLVQNPMNVGPYLARRAFFK